MEIFFYVNSNITYIYTVLESEKARLNIWIVKEKKRKDVRFD